VGGQGGAGLLRRLVMLSAAATEQIWTPSWRSGASLVHREVVLLKEQSSLKVKCSDAVDYLLHFRRPITAQRKSWELYRLACQKWQPVSALSAPSWLTTNYRMTTSLLHAIKSLLP
jgi:hypothetical protein